MKTYWGGGIAPRILYLGTRRCGQLHAPTALPPYPLCRKLCGPQSRSGRGGEEKNFQSPPEIEPPKSTVQPVASRYTDWAIPILIYIYDIHGNNMPNHRFLILIEQWRLEHTWWSVVAKLPMPQTAVFRLETKHLAGWDVCFVITYEFYPQATEQYTAV
jgi:hypothetical protein